jgi:hypothetical protein
MRTSAIRDENLHDMEDKGKARAIGFMGIYVPQKIVDICVTCVCPNPPKLPLREELPSLGAEEELPSLGAELIYNNDFCEPDEHESKDSLVDN